MSAQIFQFPRTTRRVPSTPPSPQFVAQREHVSKLLADRAEAETEKLAQLIADRAREINRTRRQQRQKRQKPESFSAAAGLHGTVDTVLRVAAWALAHRQLPTVEAFMQRWDMSRASAYRYRSRLQNSGLMPRSY